MSLHHNPKIVTDGLVFAYDMDNAAKSFKGKPTENLASSNFFDGNVNFTTDETIQDTLPTGKKGDVRYLNADYVVDPNRTVSIGSYTLTAGDTYTLSFYVKNINCTGFGGNLYSPTLTAVIGSITYPTVFTDRWTRVTKTFTIPTDTVSAGGDVVMSPQVFRDGGNGFFKLAMLQLEEGSIATPWVNGTRSNTQALLDMSKSKNTVTATSLTYNSDGTFEFDNSNPDEITAPHSSIGHPTASYTSEAWVWADSSQDNLYPRIWDKSQILVHISQTSPFSIAQNTSTSGGLRQVGVGSAFNHSTWTHIVTSYDGQVGKIYVNGSLVSTNDFGSILNPSTSTTVLTIGGNTGTTRQFNGKIDKVKLYWDKVLTAAEIQQNFNATRGRYGI